MRPRSPRLSSLAAVAALAVPAAAHAFEVQTTAEGAEVSWHEPMIEVRRDLAGGPLPAPEARAAAEAAFDAWVPFLPPEMRIAYRDPAGSDASPAQAGQGEPANAIRWVVDPDDPDRDPDALATTFVAHYVATGAVVDADIVVNAVDFAWRAGEGGGCGGGYDLQNILTHEVGHFLGLGHSDDDEGATMYPTARTCETKKRTLAPDDIEGIRHLYGHHGGVDAGESYGCAMQASAGGGSPGWGALAVILACAASVRRRRRGHTAPAVIAVLALGLGLAPSPAGATTVRHLPVVDMARASDTVVRGVVGRAATHEIDGRIYTDTVIEVTETWRGDAVPEVVVRQRGGRLGDIALAVEGGARLRRGAEVVLFLRARRDGTFAPVGLAQGAFDVVSDGVARRDLSELVLASRGIGVRGGVETWGLSRLREHVNAVTPSRSK